MSTSAGRNEMKPTIAVLLGDASGVGPEMAVKLMARPQNREAAQLLLIADPLALESGERIAGHRLDPLRVDGIDALRFEPGRPSLLAQQTLQGRAPVLGESNEHSGRAAF